MSDCAMNEHGLAAIAGLAARPMYSSMQSIRFAWVVHVRLVVFFCVRPPCPRSIFGQRSVAYLAA